MKSTAPGLPRTIVSLGLVSLLTDFSSEMIYPLLPLFLSSVLGAGALVLGFIEGVAESTASLLKALSGIWTDRCRRRKPFLWFGYGLAGLVRPGIALASSWPFVMAIRFLDRVGKGVRTSPRDALIADAVDPALRGRAYGFHRSMDHAGAVIGPLVAAALLSADLSLRTVFLLSAIPAVAVMVVLGAGVRESPARPHAPARRLALAGNWQNLGSGFRRLLLALLLFTLGNSSDAFLLLRLSGAGIPAASLAGLWSLHHGVKMVSSYAGGRLSDTTGRRGVIVAGWLVYALIYAAFAAVQTRWGLVALFVTYGVCFGLTEPAEKAWVADIVPERLRGTAFGYYNCVVGLGALPASILFGWIWQIWGAPASFLTGAAFALAATVALLAIKNEG